MGVTQADIDRIIASIREDAAKHPWTEQEIKDNWAANDGHTKEDEEDE